jgi:hypothetical protein
VTTRASESSSLLTMACKTQIIIIINFLIALNKR